METSEDAIRGTLRVLIRQTKDQLDRYERALADLEGTEKPSTVEAHAGVATGAGTAHDAKVVRRTRQEVAAIQAAAIRCVDTSPTRRAKVVEVHRALVEQGLVSDSNEDREFVRYTLRKAANKGFLHNHGRGYFEIARTDYPGGPSVPVTSTG